MAECVQGFLPLLAAAVLDAQGGCERIKKTPFPRGYGFVAERLIVIYGCIMPFGMVKDLGWVTVPFNLLVCMSFLLISESGRAIVEGLAQMLSRS